MVTMFIRLAANDGIVNVGRATDTARVTVELGEENGNKVQLDMSYSQARKLHMWLGRFCIA